MGTLFVEEESDLRLGRAAREELREELRLLFDALDEAVNTGHTAVDHVQERIGAYGFGVRLADASEVTPNRDLQIYRDVGASFRAGRVLVAGRATGVEP